MSNKKNYVLDTNVLLHDPRAMYAFGDNNVVIPIYVIDEIDNFKKDLSELGRNARQIARQLDECRAKGELSKTVDLDNGGTVSVALGSRPPLSQPGSSQKMDNLILEVAMEVQKNSPDEGTVLVTKDVNMRIRGDALGLTTTDYEESQITIDELYDGTKEIDVDGADIDSFFKDNELTCLLYTSPSPRDQRGSRMPSSA